MEKSTGDRWRPVVAAVECLEREALNEALRQWRQALTCRGAMQAPPHTGS